MARSFHPGLPMDLPGSPFRFALLISFLLDLPCERLLSFDCWRRSRRSLYDAQVLPGFPNGTPRNEILESPHLDESR